MSIDRTPTEVAEIIESFLDGRGGKWDWDAFSSVRITNATLDEIRISCVEVYERFPADLPGWYCSQAGMDELRRLARYARKMDTA